MSTSNHNSMNAEDTSPQASTISSQHSMAKAEDSSRDNSSTTPTRGQASNYDHTPGPYLASDYLHTSPNDLQSPPTNLNGSYELPGGSSSSNTPQHVESAFGEFEYPEYTHDEYGQNGYIPGGQTTPLANIDEMTPLAQGQHHQPTPASCLPQNPNMQNQQYHLQSPFKSMDPNMASYQPTMNPSDQHQYVDPNGAMYYPYAYPEGSPQNPTSFNSQQQYYQMQPTINYPPAGTSNTFQPSAPIPYGYPPPFVMGEPPRSRRISPSERSIASSAISLTRSGSNSSEMLPKSGRPKVKLTFEDKRNIVIMAREQTQLRQEDIAQKYHVDRSTISKIVINADRWLGPQPASQPVAPKQPKSLTARFPGVDAKMNDWMDRQIEMGGDIRDAVARNMARVFAAEIGFPDSRFKASAKWLDKFKDRRKAAGRPEPPPMGMGSYSLYPYPSQQQLMLQSPTEASSVMLSRSQSSLTLSSESSSGLEFSSYSKTVTPSRMAMKSEPDLIHMDSPNSRQRSQSSPQLLVGPGMQSPSSGKAPRLVRPSPMGGLQRQNSYQGSSPSPRRSTPLSRANSSQGGSRRARPNSFAASAFGITPMESGSPMNSPSTGSNTGNHSRQRSEVGLTPFANLSIASISPDMSDSGGDHSVLHPMTMTVPPMTPITPGDMNGAVFANTDYGEIQQDFGPVHQGYQVPGTGVGQVHYATMPNKHYANGHGQYQQYPQQQQYHPSVYPAALNMSPQDAMVGGWQHV